MFLSHYFIIYEQITLRRHRKVALDLSVNHKKAWTGAGAGLHHKSQMKQGLVIAHERLPLLPVVPVKIIYLIVE